MIFDSHFHLLSMKEKSLDLVIPDNLIGLECGTIPEDGEERIKLVGERRNIYISFGAGPWCTEKEDPPTIIRKLKDDIKKYGADAIGECGFDRHWNYGDEKAQVELFSFQALIAKEMNIPLIIHSREADDLLLKNINFIDERTIMHCFSSGVEILECLLEKGAYISFAGNVTYKGNTMIQEAAKLCPIERLLYETDSPYLTPLPLRGKPNTMANSELTLSFLSSIRGEDKEYIKENAVKNFLSLMNNRESVVRRSLSTL